MSVYTATLYRTCLLEPMNSLIALHTHTHTRLTALYPGLPGGPVPER